MNKTSLWITAIILGIMPSTASAESPAKCEATPAILATADYLLETPSEPTRFWHDLGGASAAYLKIRYVPLGESEARSLTNSLASREHPPERIEELEIAQLDTPALQARVKELAKASSLLSALSTIGESGQRRLLVNGDGEWLFEQLSNDSWMNEPLLDRMASSVADIGDEALTRLADGAEQRKLWEFALTLSEMKSNLTGYIALFDHLPKEKWLVGSLSIEEQRKNRLSQAVTASIMHAQPMDLLKQPIPVQVLIGERPYLILMQRMGWLVDKLPESIYLSQLFNQTGDYRLPGVVVQDMVNDISAGKLDPIKDPDAALTSMVRRLDILLGKNRPRYEEMVRNIPGFRLDTATILNQAVARNALSSFVARKSGRPLQRPKELISNFDWTRWSQIASKLRDGDSISPDDEMIAAQLLDSVGRPKEALEHLKLATDQKQARGIAFDIMQRLDRRCQDFLRPAQPGQEDIFRFEE